MRARGLRWHTHTHQMVRARAMLHTHHTLSLERERKKGERSVCVWGGVVDAQMTERQAGGECV